MLDQGLRSAKSNCRQYVSKRNTKEGREFSRPSFVLEANFAFDNVIIEREVFVDI